MFCNCRYNVKGRNYNLHIFIFIICMFVLLLIHLLNSRVNVTSVPLQLALELFPFPPYFSKAHPFEVVHSSSFQPSPRLASWWFAIRVSVFSFFVFRPLAVIFHRPFFGHPSPYHYVFNYVPIFECFPPFNILSQLIHIPSMLKLILYILLIQLLYVI